MNLGWQCPRCGHCYAPTWTYCTNCNKPSHGEIPQPFVPLEPIEKAQDSGAFTLPLPVPPSSAGGTSSGQNLLGGEPYHIQYNKCKCPGYIIEEDGGGNCIHCGVTV